MQLRTAHGLPFITVEIEFGGVSVSTANALVDTGSSNTVMSARLLSSIGIEPELTDFIRVVRGVGGTETVFCRTVDWVSVGEMVVTAMEVQVAGMDYGFNIDAIIGMDFLTSARAVIDLGQMEIKKGEVPT